MLVLAYINSYVSFCKTLSRLVICAKSSIILVIGSMLFRLTSGRSWSAAAWPSD